MSFIHQELAFVPGMTVLENIMLGLPKKTRFGMVDWRAIAEEVKPIADRVGVKAALGASAKGLSTAENWLINITRALVRKSRLIVMDEPTAALSAAESERLFAIVRDLRKSGRRRALCFASGSTRFLISASASRCFAMGGRSPNLPGRR